MDPLNIDGIVARPGYVLVAIERTSSIEHADLQLAKIDGLLQEMKVERVLFDTRVTETPTPEVNAHMWRWTQTGAYHRRLAIVVNNPELQLRGNMTARALGVELRSFANFERAEQWLLRPFPAGNP